jgi:hypothetical protein
MRISKIPLYDGSIGIESPPRNDRKSSTKRTERVHGSWDGEDPDCKDDFEQS